MIIKGVTTFFSETGTEGGYWAVQDEKHIHPNTTRFVCTKCHMYWDKNRSPDEPTFKGWCPVGQHDFKLANPENWDYEGLHILKDGDHLTIFQKDEVLIRWKGVVHLEEMPFEFGIFGWRTHSRELHTQDEIWAELFHTGYPSILEPKDEFPSHL